MPAHFTVATHPANQIKITGKLDTPLDLLNQSWGAKQQSLTCGELLQSSIANVDLPSIQPQQNGFFLTAIAAYNGHHHLIIRPDDVWIAILAQFNFYVNAHAEELRSQFVQHEGKKALEVTAAGTRYTVDFGALANQMTAEIHKNVIDEELRSWVLPDFSTTSKNDTVTCAVLMMATMKTYFSYTMSLACGIPSVTLQGEKSDWEKLLLRLDKLPTFGPEPAAWAKLLRPILRRFVQAFDGEPDVDFWGQICHRHSNFSGPDYLSGWITAFSVWSSEGKWHGPSLSSIESPEDTSGGLSDTFGPRQTKLILDGVVYPHINANRDVSVGFCEVDVNLNDNGKIFDCLMVSGHVGYRVEGNADTLRPFPAWFMFTKGDPKPTPEWGW
ncbi:hypothetical protein BDZ94DRAFT_1257569 [Collybia nuda]|uniref:Uncharacterized protein n=1 Tax=Collybia nuda TaxID=64659 RepID=A0A9P5Y7Y9_9AGAR|nr:hypothetical protein BDZ94DRAFT_1257569 [Collybia nuda]